MYWEVAFTSSFQFNKELCDVHKKKKKKRKKRGGGYSSDNVICTDCFNDNISLPVDSCSSNLVFAFSWEQVENSEVEAVGLVQRSTCYFVTNMLAVYGLIFFYVVSNKFEHQCSIFHFAQKVLPACWIFFHCLFNHATFSSVLSNYPL